MAQCKEGDAFLYSTNITEFIQAPFRHKETLVNTGRDGPYPYGVYSLMKTDTKERREGRRQGGREEGKKQEGRKKKMIRVLKKIKGCTRYCRLPRQRAPWNQELNGSCLEKNSGESLSEKGLFELLSESYKSPGKDTPVTGTHCTKT